MLLWCIYIHHRLQNAQTKLSDMSSTLENKGSFPLVTHSQTKSSPKDNLQKNRRTCSQLFGFLLQLCPCVYGAEGAKLKTGDATRSSISKISILWKTHDHSFTWKSVGASAVIKNLQIISNNKKPRTHSHTHWHTYTQAQVFTHPVGCGAGTVVLKPFTVQVLLLL